MNPQKFYEPTHKSTKTLPVSLTGPSTDTSNINNDGYLIFTPRPNPTTLEPNRESIKPLSRKLSTISEENKDNNYYIVPVSQPTTPQIEDYYSNETIEQVSSVYTVPIDQKEVKTELPKKSKLIKEPKKFQWPKSMDRLRALFKRKDSLEKAPFAKPLINKINNDKSITLLLTQQGVSSDSTQLDDHLVKIARLEEDLKRLNDNISTQNYELTRLSLELKDTSENAQNLATQIKTKDDEIAIKNNEIKNLTTFRNAALAQLTEKDSETKALDQKIGTIAAELENANAQLQLYKNIKLSKPDSQKTLINITRGASVGVGLVVGGVSVGIFADQAMKSKAIPTVFRTPVGIGAVILMAVAFATVFAGLWISHSMKSNYDNIQKILERVYISELGIKKI